MTAPARPAVPIPPPLSAHWPTEDSRRAQSDQARAYSHYVHKCVASPKGSCARREKAGLQWVWEQKLPELSTSVFVIPGGHVKNTEDRLVVMNETARAVIEVRRGEHATHVFSLSGKPVAKMNNTAWQRARREAAQQYEAELGRPCPAVFAKVRVHDLKHTYGRRLPSVGVSLETRKLLLGHKNGDITTHYSAAEIGELIAASSRISAAKGTPNITLLRVANG